MQQFSAATERHMSKKWKKLWLGGESVHQNKLTVMGSAARNKQTIHFYLNIFFL